MIISILEDLAGGDVMAYVIVSAISIAFTYFFTRWVFSIPKQLALQERTVKLLEAIYTQNGGNLNDLLPEEYKDKTNEQTAPKYNGTRTAELDKLKEKFDNGFITESEYTEGKKEIYSR